tara:strand:- start:209 stop:955 length:747 start_codon:yes stop_codon:yes gene_type:complete
MKIELPKDWSAVTVRQFQALQGILSEDGGEYEKNVAIISIMSGASVDDIEDYTLKTYAQCMKTLEFLTQPLPEEKVMSFISNGKKYRVLSDVYDLNGGQYITLMHLLKDPEKVIDNLHEVMSVFCVPYSKKWYGWKRSKYNSKEHNKVAEEMLEVPMSIVQPLSAFFLSSYLTYAKVTLESSVKELEKIKTKAEKKLARSTVNTDGSTPLTTSVITTLQNGATSSISSLKSSLTSFRFKRRSKRETTS